MDQVQTMAEWEPQQCASMEINGGLASASGHWTHGGLRRRAVGDWTRAWGDDQEERNIAMARTEDGGYLQRLADRNSTSGPSGTRPGAAIREEDQSGSAGIPRIRDRDRDSLDSGTLRDPSKQRGGPGAKPAPSHQWRHGDRAAIHLALE